MNVWTTYRSQKRGLIKRIVLAVALIVAGAIVISQAAWVYQSIHRGMGAQIAEATLAFDVVLTLVLMTAGIALGYIVDWMIRRQKFVFHSLHAGSWTERLVHLWGYELKYHTESTIQADLEAPIIPNLDSFELIDRPRRRGRKPTFPLERWLPIAVQWENRDPIRDAFTLGELISEHLGTNSDGSPVVSEQTYYSTWRERALQELGRRAQSRKTSASSKPQSENNP